MAASEKKRAKLAAIEALALLFDSSGKLVHIFSIFNTVNVLLVDYRTYVIQFYIFYQVKTLIFFSFASGSGNVLDDTNFEKDYRPEKECQSGSEIETGQQIEEETTAKSSSAVSDSWSESEHDDSYLDTDCRPEKDDCSESNSDTDSTQQSEEETGEEVGGERREETGAALETTVVKRQKCPRPHMWKGQVIKEKLLKGESFKNAKGQEKQPKTMGPPYKSQYCLRSKKDGLRLGGA